ncbi:DUF6480 family protein [Streptomyces sp. NPDC002018]|uniref:DUF6480 family protein n=1 Tax=Streptomyces sp. NPDC002018 TaxID=3364629 RepID=UPI0036961E08
MTDHQNEPEPKAPGPRGGPRVTTAPAPERKVPPGETPPGEGGLSGAGPQETHNPTTGWSKGPLAAILIVSLFVAGFFLAYAVIVQSI